MNVRKLLYFDQSSKGYYSLMSLLTLLCFGFSDCTHQDASIATNEKVEMKRFTKIKLAENLDEPTEMAIMDDGKVI